MSTGRNIKTMALGLGLSAALLAPQAADAFCGFYVAGAEGSLYNNATQVVLMREGQRTVMSIQNNYKGPAEDFALVIPVPVILQQENVKTLDPALFAKVDTLSAPRLVEYWEQDPCQGQDLGGIGFGSSDEAADFYPTNPVEDNGVEVEAEFSVGEYDIVILSADDATGLDNWLTTNGYNIPEGAAPVLDPYVEGGQYFFVAEVSMDRVTYEDGLAVLSPLRFHYDSDTFALPIRLGLMNADGPQDLLIYTLGQEQRYEVANYPNVTIPTNIAVGDAVRDDFGAFFEALYQRTIEDTPGAIVTEYSWDSSTCDPCPGPTLDASEIMTLGADVMPGQETWGWTLTRLHARYTPDSLGEDLIFKEAPPIMGGRQVYDDNGNVMQGTEPVSASVNNFQGRYIIYNEWQGPVLCLFPNYGVWGGPPDGSQGNGPSAATSPNTQGEEPSSRDKGLVLENYLAESVPQLGIIIEGCGCNGSGTHPGPAGALLSLLGLAGALVLRQR